MNDSAGAPRQPFAVGARCRVDDQAEGFRKGVLSEDAIESRLFSLMVRWITPYRLADLRDAEERFLFGEVQYGQGAIDMTAHVAFAVLESRSPTQMPGSEHLVEQMIHHFIIKNAPGLPRAHNPAMMALARRHRSWMARVLDRVPERRLDEDDRARSVLVKKFPRKRDRMASRKVNVFLDTLLDDLFERDPALYATVVDYLSGLKDGVFYEDQVCCAVLYCWAARQVLPPRVGLKFALVSIYYPQRAKSLSNILKALGYNRFLLGACCCESSVMAGRGSGDIDLLEDAAPRLGLKASLAVRVDENELRRQVAQILGEELRDRRPASVSLQRFWCERFKWCVGGAHGKSTNDEAYWGGLGSLDELGQRMSRRVAVEHVSDNIMPLWDGTVKVSLLPKLECGKVRAIYSCNTMSYLWFSRLLRPIEEAWRGERVILDPGHGGSTGMCSRILGLRRNGYNTYCMLDYADFNSQHTLRSQQIVIEETLKYVGGWTEEERTKLVDSFNHMYLYKDGKELGKVHSTLMSGHRATSYINSILNAAYLRMSVGASTYDQVRSLHVGDDVLILTRNHRVALSIKRAVERKGFHIQAAKQSVGSYSFEFLRVCGTETAARGYLCRSVASLVGGNWTNDQTLKPRECLAMLVQQCRSLINRSENPRAWELLRGTCLNKTGLDPLLVDQLLSGRVAIEPGPCYRSDGRYVSVRLEEVEDLTKTRTAPAVGYRDLPHFATRDYISEGAADLERLACELSGFIPWAAAVRSSYGDLAPSLGSVNSAQRRQLRADQVRTRWKRGAVAANSVWGKDKKHGLLAHYPLIALLQNALSYESIVRLLEQINRPPVEGRAVVDAFGGVEEGATVDGLLPYGDAAALAQYEIAGTVKATYPVAV